MLAECSWNPPPLGVPVQTFNPDGDWWELYDPHHKLPYYYHTKTKQTEWNRPQDERIISLVKLQQSNSRFPGMSSLSTGSDGRDNISISAVSDHGGQLPGDDVPVSSLYSTSPPPTSSPPATLRNLQSAILSQRVVPEVLPTNISAVQSVGSRPGSGGSVGMTPVVQRPSTGDLNLTAAAAETRPNSSAATGTRPNSRLPNDLIADINQFKIEGFAKQFFSTHKRGIFRKRVPVDRLVVWEKDTLNKPLLNLSKSIHKEALACFKFVQKAMGDRTGKRRAAEETERLLSSGVLNGELRDEIYCQVVKQLTNNPSRDSIYKGWELMSALAVTFPPSKNFELYLRKFLSDHVESEDLKTAVFAKHCLTKMERISIKGPRGKVPTIAEIERAMEAPFSPSVFGESLADIMALQSGHYPMLRLPRIMTFLAEAIIELNGCSTEGIFRVPGDADAVTELRVRIEKDNYDISGITEASVPASLFKFWLRDLTDPIIPTDLYQNCIDNAEDPEKALKIVQQIPEHNRNVLLYLIGFLQVISDPKNQPITRMSVNNIAMVFAPNILRCPSDNLQLVLENTKFEQAFVRNLIDHLKTDAFKTMK